MFRRFRVAATLARASDDAFMPPFPWSRAFSLIVLMIPFVSRGVIIVGDESQSTVAPQDDFGFENVGQVTSGLSGFISSGIYLGNGWMLSAYHVVHDANSDGGFNFGTVYLGGIGYAVDSSTGVRLHNPDQSPADLALFRLTTIPSGLPSVSISGTVPANNTSVIMAGNGYHREATQTQWNVDGGTNPPTWTETSGTGDHQGYYWDYTQTLRWGANTLISAPISVDDGFGITTTVRTSFTAGIDGESQAAAGDSGGGLFSKSSGNWQLLGILLTTDNFPGQPSTVSPSSIFHDSAVFGNDTYAADLPIYRSQIVAIIPEPGTGMLLASGAIMFLGARRRLETMRRGIAAEDRGDL